MKLGTKVKYTELLERERKRSAAEHYSDCPVANGASVDCAPPGDCARRHATGERVAGGGDGE